MKSRLIKWTETILISVKAGYIAAAIPIYLFLSWLMCFMIDVRNWWGLREIFTIKEHFVLGGEMAPLWFIIFREAGPTEILQWIALLITALGSGVMAARLLSSGYCYKAAFWKLIAIAAGLMFLEDAANIRHLINYIIFLIGGWDWDSVAGQNFRGVLELAYFAVLGFLPIYALLRYGKHIASSRQTLKYLLMGYFFYGIAAMASGTRFIDNWYTRAGTEIYLFMDRLAEGDLVEVSTEAHSMEFWLMDLLVEESLELIGAGLLLTSVLAYSGYISLKYGAELIKINRSH